MKENNNKSNNNKSNIDKPNKTIINSKTRIQDIKDPEERKKVYQEAKEGKYKDNKHLQAISKNLIPLNQRDPEEAKAIRRKGAEAINRARGEKKTAKQILDVLLPLFANRDAINNNNCIPEDIKKEILRKNIQITQYDLIMLAQIYQAQQGNVKAADFIASHNGDIVVKETHNINESMSEADKKLIEKLSDRLNIVDTTATEDQDGSR